MLRVNDLCRFYASCIIACQTTYPAKAPPYARPVVAEGRAVLSEAWVETLEVEVLMPLPLKPMVCPWKCRIALRLVQLVEPWWLLPPLMPLPLNPMVDVPMVRVWLPCWLLGARGVQSRIRCVVPASRTSCNPRAVALPSGGNGYIHQGLCWKNFQRGQSTQEQRISEARASLKWCVRG